MGRHPIGEQAMSGTERQRRYWARIRARLAAAAALAPKVGLTWQRKGREATGTASDGTEYVIARVPDSGEFELGCYDESGRFHLIGDGFPNMAAAERAAEAHNAERRRPSA